MARNDPKVSGRATTPVTMLVDAYDCALFDLDGVVYLGPRAVPGAGEGIKALRARGVRVGFVTNNAARTPATVAEHLTELGVSAEVTDVVTSSQAGARMVATQLPPGSRVLIVGTRALAAEVASVGLEPVWRSSDDPAAVLQGYDPEMTWPRLDDACFAIQAGARWFATNTDLNRPTDRGRVPGAGSQIAAVASSVDVAPEVAGKPCRPLLDETVRRLDAQNPIFVGDRIDTDIMGAHAVGMDSLFVFTGTHGKYDLATADAPGRPTHIGADLRALLQPPRVASVDHHVATCGLQRVELDGVRTRLLSAPDTLETQLDALWASLHLVWAHPGAGFEALDQLSLIG